MGPEKARRADEQDSGRSGGGLVLILGWIMLALFTPTDVRGGDCFEYGEYLHYVGSL